MEGRRIITTKAINTQLKYHWTLEKFCTHYNVSEEEFFNTVATLFPKGADEVRRKLQKNENFKHGKKQSDAPKENKVVSDIPENGGKGQLYGGGPGDEFHPVRREPRGAGAGGRAGRRP